MIVERNHRINSDDSLVMTVLTIDFRYEITIRKSKMDHGITGNRRSPRVGPMV